MKITQNKNLIANARSLRKNMTDEERKLWYLCLRTLPQKFRRQQIIGNYIADFYCDSLKLAIELDGSQHYEPDKQLKDKMRTAYIESLGIRVLRFSNTEVNKEFSAVCDAVYLALNE